MSKSLLSQLNILSENKYNYLKLSSIDVNIPQKKITVNLLYPEGWVEIIKQDRENIIPLINKILKSGAEVNVKFILSHFDETYVKIEFLKFLNQYPAIFTSIEETDLYVNSKEKIKKVTLSLSPHIYKYCEEKNIINEINTYFETGYCDKVEFELTEKDDNSEPALPEAEITMPKTVLSDSDSDRTILCQNVDSLVGSIIYEKAKYIEDANYENPNLVVCGSLTELNTFNRKPKEGELTPRVFYRLKIEDFTSSIEGLYFPTKYTKDKITLLKTGKEVLVRGSLEKDKKDESRLVFIIKDICFCTLPKDFVPNRIIRVIDEHYRYVFPKAYISKQQSSLFDVIDKVPNSVLKNNTFCVFDIETTGLNPRENKIIELSAVKVVNGIFKETFSSLIDPGIPIPESITALTGISDMDVYGMPKIEEVLPDFYKFCENCILVAQNLQFDLSFINEKGKPLNIYFENKTMDTLYLSRKYYPGLKKYKLDYLADYFGVILDGAHRALNDAIATAEIFVKITDKMDNIS